MKYKKYYLLYIIIILISLIILYAYNSGSCQINKKNYICTKDFCLHKEFYYELPHNILNEINTVLEKKELQKRVSIKTYPEMIFNCAMPNRSGVTIPTNILKEYCPQLINLYQNNLTKYISQLINIKLEPTDLKYPTSCAVIIYEKEDDWINWHYDHNYYNGRFFTVLIPITNNLTCTKFQFMDPDNNTISLDLNKKGICFEGDFVFHRASKLCTNQTRAILSCQYVTTNEMNNINELRIKLKDYAFIGQLI